MGRHFRFSELKIFGSCRCFPFSIPCPPPCLSDLLCLFVCGFFPKAKAFFLPFKVWSCSFQSSGLLNFGVYLRCEGREAAWAKEKKPSERSELGFFSGPKLSLALAVAWFTNFPQCVVGSDDLVDFDFKVDVENSNNQLPYIS